MVSKKSIVLFIFLIFFLCDFIFTFSLPDLPRNTYKKNQVVNVKARKLSSQRNLPFDFYSVKYCYPEPRYSVAENIGELLFGDNVMNSVYKLKFLENVQCKKIETCLEKTCNQKVKCPTIKSEDVDTFISRIKDNYQMQLIVDNLPVANLQVLNHCGERPSKQELSTDPDKGKIPVYSNPEGIPMGCTYLSPPEKGKKSEKVYVLNNHITFIMKYNKKDNSIVGAEAIPSSIEHTDKSCVQNVPIPKLPKLELISSTTKTKKQKTIKWSYSVIWKESNIQYPSRWDAYLNTGTDFDEYRIHWFSIVNSFMIVLLLSVMIAMIMMRVLHKDITDYNEQDQDVEDFTDETGWKAVFQDVFRTPMMATLLSIFIGSGIQVFMMAIITIIFAGFGFLSPHNRGNLFAIMLIIYVLMGVFAGYYSLRFYKMFGGKHWKTVTLLTSLLFPSIVFSIFLLINFIVWAFGYTRGGFPILTVLLIIGLWFGVTLPLVVIGGYFGFKKKRISHPVKVINKIPKRIDKLPIYMKAPFTILMAGILPFGAVFIECYFIMQSIWLGKFYFLFGFLFVVFVILLITCSEITIVLIYFQLCSGDYRWWWRAFFTSGSAAFYLFLYSIFYFYSKLKISNLITALYFFSLMVIISFYFFIMTGSVGFLACFWFVRKIYSSIKLS